MEAEGGQVYMGEIQVLDYQSDEVKDNQSGCA